MKNEVKKYYSVSELAKLWGLSERTVRNYCATGKIKAELIGKTWQIPHEVTKPLRSKRRPLLEVLKDEKKYAVRGGIYHKIQVDLTYNSNHIEGSKLTHEQTRFIFETNTIGVEGESFNVDDIVETVNHFRCIDHIIDTANRELTEGYIKHLHLMLKSGTSDELKEWFAVGEYKKLPNEVGGKRTTRPEKVASEIAHLLLRYKSKESKTFEDLVEFHQKFESIHPFQDGNGRVGRLLLFKECLRYGVTPFIIDERHKLYYYQGLRKWGEDKTFLLETCRSAQDQFKLALEYFAIPYAD